MIALTAAAAVLGGGAFWAHRLTSDSPGARPSPSEATTPTPSAPAAAPLGMSPLLREAQTRGESGVAASILDALSVKGRGPRTGYDRQLFGQRWADVDRNGCDTRNDVLRRDLTDVVLVPGTRGCAVATGTLLDPFGGGRVAFRRGETPEVQIDHLVALADAWQKGAAGWTLPRRETFANDPRNLLAVSGSGNAQKQDSDAASWLPPNRRLWCAYVSAQISIKAEYGLSVTPAERRAMSRALTYC